MMMYFLTANLADFLLGMMPALLVIAQAA